MREVLTGSVNWSVGQWRESFYPEDIPEDWLLGYYANEFLTTVLDVEHLATARQQEELGEQLIDCHEGFRPVLHWDSRSVPVEKTAEILTWLKNSDEELGLSRLAGIWISTTEPADELSKLREYRAAIDIAVPISMSMSADLLASSAREIEALKIFPVMDIETGELLSMHYWLALVSLDQSSRELASQIRMLLESADNSKRICLLAKRGYEDIDKLQSLNTIVGLIAN